MTTRKASRRSGGFSLVETVATIVVVATIAGVTSGMVLDAANQYKQAVVRAELSERASAAISFILDEVRNINITTYNTPIPYISDECYTDVIAYRDQTSTNCYIYLSGTSVLYSRDYFATNRTLLTDCTSLSFTYYNKDNVATTTDLDPALFLRMVEVTITLSKDGVTHTVRSRAFIRGTQAGSGVL